MFTLICVACKPINLKDKFTGESRSVYRLTLVLPDCDTVKMYSKRPFERGDEVELVPYVNKDGYLVLRVDD